MNFDIAFIGFGMVGRGLADLLLEKRDLLRGDYGVEWRVVAISDLKVGSIMDDRGIDLKEAVRLADSKVNLETMPARKKGLSPLEAIRESAANTIVEVTWTNLTDGEPGHSHIKSALSLGKHVITTNKGPLALHFRELVDLARVNSVALKFKGTVLSGTPSFNLFDGPLSACSISSMKGIVNGTTNFILSEMVKGKEYADVLKQAQNIGYAEADPTLDVEGWDAAAKLAILANFFFGVDIKPSNVKREGISSITLDDIASATKRDKRIKLIARAVKTDVALDLEVAPTPLPFSDPLANVMGVTNALTFSTDCLGDVTIVGPGAGRRATGYSLLTDMISIARG